MKKILRNTGVAICDHSLLNISGAIAIATVVMAIALAWPAHASQEADGPAMRAAGIAVQVPDLQKARAFYEGTLGLTAMPAGKQTGCIELRTRNGRPLWLREVRSAMPVAAKESQPSLTLQVNDLAPAIAAIRAKRVVIRDAVPRKEGVGFAVTIEDPFGNPISLMHQTIRKVEPFDEPRLYNFGLYVPDMDVARQWFERERGFIPMTDRYLPLDMPLLHPDRSFALMLHAREGVVPATGRSVGNAPVVLVFQRMALAKNEAGPTSLCDTEPKPLELPSGVVGLLM